MKWEALLGIVSELPVFKTSLLLSGEKQENLLRQQMVRWVGMGRLIQLKRGLYLPAPPFRKKEPHPFLLANAMVEHSYVSLQSALAYRGLIPEHVPVTTSVTTGRPGEFRTVLGAFSFRHVGRSMFHEYALESFSDGQQAFVSLPEKALLDLIYLTPGGDRLPFLMGLRLQNLQSLDGKRLEFLAKKCGKPKMLRAAEHLKWLIRNQEVAP